MTIDVHSHWRPPALIEALRARTKPPLVETGADGIDVLIDVLRTKSASTPLAEAFDDVDRRLADMDAHGVTTAALSLHGQFRWIEALPAAESLPLVRLFNDGLGKICANHPGRFVGFAALPLADIDTAVAELDRAMALPGMVGAQLPGNAFETYAAVTEYRPLLAAADHHKAVLFVHFGPRPGDPWPRVAAGTDNMTRRIGTLGMQASLSSNMLTLCMTDILDDYAEARIQLHNLGGNIAFEVERLDHRNYLDTPDEPLPSTRLARPNVFVDCNSFGPRAIEAGIAAYGAEMIVYGTDGTAFGCDWTNKALARARIAPHEREAILHHNAARMLGHLAPLAPHRDAIAAEKRDAIAAE